MDLLDEALRNYLHEGREYKLNQFLQDSTLHISETQLREVTEHFNTDDSAFSTRAVLIALPDSNRVERMSACIHF